MTRPPETPEPPVLTPAALAVRWSVSPQTVVKLILRGELPGTQIGRQWRVRPSDMATYERRHLSQSAHPRDAEVAS